MGEPRAHAQAPACILEHGGADATGQIHACERARGRWRHHPTPHPPGQNRPEAQFPLGTAAVRRCRSQGGTQHPAVFTPGLPWRRGSGQDWGDARQGRGFLSLGDLSRQQHKGSGRHQERREMW